jgi:hypothetical protein
MDGVHVRPPSLMASQADKPQTLETSSRPPPSISGGLRLRLRQQELQIPDRAGLAECATVRQSFAIEHLRKTRMSPEDSGGTGQGVTTK